MSDWENHLYGCYHINLQMQITDRWIRGECTNKMIRDYIFVFVKETNHE